MLLRIKNTSIISCVLLQLIALVTIGQTDFYQTSTLKKITPYALKGNDTTLILLENIKPSINFDSKDDSAFEYLMVKTKLHLSNFNRDLLEKTIAEAEDCYKQSDNVRLKLWFDIIRSFYLDRNKREANLKKCLARAETLGDPDLLIEVKLYLARYYKIRSNWNAAEFHSQDAICLAEENKNNLQKASALQAFAEVLFSQGESERASNLFDQAKTIYLETGYDLRVANIIDYEAITLRKRGHYAKALQYLQQNLSTYERYKHNYRISTTNRAMGIILQDYGRNEEAIDKFELALNNITIESNPFQVIRLNRNIGECFLDIENYEEAEIYLKKSIAFQEKIVGLSENMFRQSYNSLGKLYLKLHRLDNAEIHFNKAIDISKKIKSNNTLDISYIGLLQIYLKKNDLRKAKRYGEKALSLSRENEEILIEHTALSLLSSVETKLGNHKQSNIYHKQSDALQDSILNFKEVLNFANVKADFENQATELENSNLKIENQQKEAIIREKKLLSNLYFLGLISAIITLVLLFRNFKQKNKLNTQLAEVNNSLNASNQELERFAHMASHDLKTPIRTMTSYSDLVQEMSASKLAPKEMEYLNFISNCGRSLSSMIDDVLSYSKIDSQNIELRKVEMNVLLEDLFFTIKDQAEEKSIALKQLTPFPTVLADMFKIKRVLQNIASNAIKFSDVNKDSKYVHFAHKELQDHHQFIISDNGIGIADTSTNIFKPYTYLNSQDSYKGTGMGLAMCEKIINKHGGKIWYESTLGVGTDFYFTIKKQINKTT